MSDTYEVGYGKPPKHSRYQKGQSGNLRGRPRGSKNMLTQIRDELLGYIVTSDGKKVSKVVALIKALYARAIKGDVRAIKLLLDMIPALEALTIQEREDKSVEGARILQEMIRETFMPFEDEKHRERADEEPPEKLH